MAGVRKIQYHGVYHDILPETQQDVEGLKTDVDTLFSNDTQFEDDLDDIRTELTAFPDSAYVEDGTAHFMHGDIELFTVTGIGGGGGGGGGEAISTITANNTMGWWSKTLSEGAQCVISMTWSSVADGVTLDTGTATIKVNNATVATLSVPTGAVNFDVTQYLGSGTNKVQIVFSDQFGSTTRPFVYTISVVKLEITSSFDPSVAYDDSFRFTYTPTGAIDKTVYFYVDGTLIGTQDIGTITGRQQSYMIPSQTHGSHTLLVYFEGEVNGETVRSNELFYDFIYLDPSSNQTIITSNFNQFTQQQYSSIVIPYTVYNPRSITADVTISANGTVVSTQTDVDRTEHTYTYRANDAGTLIIAIASGNTTKTLTITVTESAIDVEAETEDLALYLSSQGRSNSEANPAVWTYGEDTDQIACTFSGFNWTSDGWVSDEDGITVLRVSGDARLTIPYQIFGSDFRTTGKTIELEFATRNVLNYDATILSCMNDNKGLTVTAQRAWMKSEQTEIGTQYKEDEHVRIAFVVEKRAENRLVFVYINGIVSGCIQYPADDDFSQGTPVNISVGSSDCTIDLYNIRVYDNDLTRFQVLDNWIADTQNGALMLDRYTHNNVFDAYGNIVVSDLPSDLPYLILSCAELPQSKGDKKTCAGEFHNPTVPSRDFTFTGAQIDVQGTSSQYYPRKNYKIKFKNGIIDANGTAAETYAMNSTAVPTDVFCFKADYASSEGANNVELVRLYNEACPYKTPAQLENAKVRQGIDGFPMVIFWNDTSTNTTSFLGK